MKIAQVAPLYESVPPKYYGGTERAVSYLTEALVALGHQVTLYASGDSTTKAKLRSTCPKALRLDKKSIDSMANHIELLEKVIQESDEFDIIHFHIDYLPFPLMRRMKTPSLSTLHGRLDIPDLKKLYQEFNDIPLVSISNQQRLPLHQAKWIGNVYHGLPEDLYNFQEKPGKYLAFLGRISPEKRLDRAIKIAKKVGMPLKIAAKIDPFDRDYFKNTIQPMLNDSKIEYLGEINEIQKREFLGNALALLFPIDWPEPFGLVMIEAMASGTPTIAYPHGSVLEIMENGVTGYIASNLSNAIKAIEKIPFINRLACRKTFEARFTAKRMAEDYIKIYQKVIEGKMQSCFSF